MDDTILMMLAWEARELYSGSGALKQSSANYRCMSRPTESYMSGGRFGPHTRSRFGNIVWSSSDGRWFQW